MAASNQPVRAESSRRPGGEAPRSEAARLQKAFAERLADLERRVKGDEIDESRAHGSLAQFLADVASEVSDVGSRAWRSLAGTRTRALRVVEAFGSPHLEESGVDARLRDAFADALRPAARGWLGLKLRIDIPLPQRGAVAVAFNRSAWPLPLEAMVLSAAVAERARRHDVYVLWDPAVTKAPGLGRILRRLGVFPAVPGAARELLEKGALVLCFPEGGAAREKSYAQRYKLARFADDFLIGEACAVGAPVVPAAILGHEESFPVLGRIAGIPLTPTFPFTGALGLVPLPLGWKVHIGVPVPYEERAAGDALEGLRGRIQSLLGDLVSERRSIIRG